MPYGLIVFYLCGAGAISGVPTSVICGRGERLIQIKQQDLGVGPSPGRARCRPILRWSRSVVSTVSSLCWDPGREGRAAIKAVIQHRYAAIHTSHAEW